MTLSSPRQHDVRSSFRWRRLAMMVTAFGLIALVGCAEDPDANAPSPSFGGDEDAGVDAGDVADDPDDVGPQEDTGENGDDNGDDDNGDDDEIPDGCPSVHNFGELGELDGGTETESIEFDTWDGQELSTECDDVVDGDELAMIRFETDEPGALTLEFSDPVAMDLRFGGCDDSAGQVLCGDQTFEDTEFPRSSSGVFSLVEPVGDTPLDSVELTVTFEPQPVCDMNTFEPTCVDDETINVCTFTSYSPDVERDIEVECPVGCEGERCVGDSCDNPIEVSAPMFVQATTRGLHNEFDSEGVESCEVDGSTMTPGDDFVIELPDLSTDNEVSINLEHDHGTQAVVEIMSECAGQGECLEAWRGEEQQVFVPPESGDYYLVIGSEIALDADFQFLVEIDPE